LSNLEVATVLPIVIIYFTGYINEVLANTQRESVGSKGCTVINPLALELDI